MMSNGGTREILIEYTRIGNIIRVNAVDAQTGTEITFQAPPHATPASMERLAAQKLKYVLGKKS